jgi:hypothetical protein
MFTLRNFNIHVDQLEEIGVEAEEIALQMADALAIMHWKARIDADDIEFVLGSAATLPKAQIPKSEDLRTMAEPEEGTG